MSPAKAQPLKALSPIPFNSSSLEKSKLDNLLQFINAPPEIQVKAVQPSILIDVKFSQNPKPSIFSNAEQQDKSTVFKEEQE